MGEIRGTLRMRSHIVALRTTTKFLAKSFVFKNIGAKEGLKKDDPSGLGAGGPRFKSGRPDQNIFCVFFSLLKAPFTPKLICGILAGRRSQSATRLMPKSSPRGKFSKTRRGRSAIQKLLN
jgi:hypothetical protein